MCVYWHCSRSMLHVCVTVRCPSLSVPAGLLWAPRGRRNRSYDCSTALPQQMRALACFYSDVGSRTLTCSYCSLFMTAGISRKECFADICLRKSPSILRPIVNLKKIAPAAKRAIGCVCVQTKWQTRNDMQIFKHWCCLLQFSCRVHLCWYTHLLCLYVCVLMTGSILTVLSMQPLHFSVLYRF